MHADIGATGVVENLRRLIGFYAGTADAVFTTSDAVGQGRVAPTAALAEAILHAAAKAGAIALIEPGLWEALTDEVLDTDFMGVVNAIVLRAEPRPDTPAEQGEVPAVALPVPEVKAPAASPRPERSVVAGLMSARDAAKVLGICDKSLWNATKRGDIPAVRLGRSVRYDPRDLTRWVETSKAKG